MVPRNNLSVRLVSEDNNIALDDHPRSILLDCAESSWCDRSDLSPAIVHKYFLPYLESVPIRKRHQIIAVSLEMPETR